MTLEKLRRAKELHDEMEKYKKELERLNAIYNSERTWDGDLIITYKSERFSIDAFCYAEDIFRHIIEGYNDLLDALEEEWKEL